VFHVNFFFGLYVFTFWITCNFGINLHNCFLFFFLVIFCLFLTMAPLKPLVCFKFHHFFFYSR
jgi:hypothetical protein